jgi:hypothetical protein
MRKATMRTVAAVATASLCCACMTATTEKKIQTLRIATDPPGGYVWKDDGTEKKPLGYEPQTVDVKYESTRRSFARLERDRGKHPDRWMKESTIPSKLVAFPVPRPVQPAWNGCCWYVLLLGSCGTEIRVMTTRAGSTRTRNGTYGSGQCVLQQSEPSDSRETTAHELAGAECFGWLLRRSGSA